MVSPPFALGSAGVCWVGATVDIAGVFEVAPLAVLALAVGETVPWSVCPCPLMPIAAVGCSPVVCPLGAPCEKCQIRIPHEL